MLARCFIQPLRASTLLLSRPPARTLLAVRTNLKSQLIKDRKFTTSQPFFNKDNKSNSYARLREKLGQQGNVESLAEFEYELSQLGLIQKFKKIVSEYYHVICLVHAVTSAGWFSLAFLIKYQ